jgi:hypothetical protein
MRKPSPWPCGRRAVPLSTSRRAGPALGQRGTTSLTVAQAPCRQTVFSEGGRWYQGVLQGEYSLPRGYQEGGVTGWYWSRSVACRHLPVPSFGTTLIRRNPFEYHLYRLSHLNLEGCRDRTRDSDADRSEFGDGSPADREGPPSQLEPDTGRTQRKWSKVKLTSPYSRRVTRGDQTARGKWLPARSQSEGLTEPQQGQIDNRSRREAHRAAAHRAHRSRRAPDISALDRCRVGEDSPALDVLASGPSRQPARLL